MCPACGISDAASPSFLQRRGRWRSWRCPCHVCLWARRQISLCWMYPEGLLRASVSSFLGWDGSHRVGRKWGKALPTSWGNSMQVSLPMQRLFFFFFRPPLPLPAPQMIRDASPLGLALGFSQAAPHGRAHQDPWTAGVSPAWAGAAQVGGAAAFCPPAKCHPLHLAALRTGNPISRSPRECQAHPEGKNPEEVIKGDRGVIARNR